MEFFNIKQHSRRGVLHTPLSAIVRNVSGGVCNTPLRLVFGWFVALLCFSSCTEKIDLKLKTSETRLVVEGGVSFESCEIILSTTMPYFSSTDDIPFVSNAEVKITEFDENMQATRLFELIENPIKAGHYSYSATDNVYGQQRHTYRLNISLNEPIGGRNVYTSETVFPPIADRIDSVRAVWGQNLFVLMLAGRDRDTNSIRTGWNIEVFADDPDGENYYALIVLKNGVPLNDTLTRLLLFDNQMIRAANIGLRGVPMAYISDSSDAAAQEGDTLGLEIRGVSQDYYRYIHEFSNVYGGSNPMFGGVPANVRGNISDGAIGYFWAHGSRKAFDIADKSKSPTMKWCETLEQWLSPELFHLCP
ncbi:MAG: DUF4249 domain-containing protein [Bacteroidales bacterium]|nr:DUF4249 domain-containing protein [Bacteroidales bacterium]